MKKVLLVLLAATALPCTSVLATHLRAADILVEPDCTRPLTFRITVIAYMNTLSSTRFGDSELRFGDGSMAMIPETPTTPRPDLGPNMGTASYTTTHSYLTAGTYTLMYMERDRSRGVVNILNSEDVAYTTFLTMTVNPALGCNHTPVLSVPPIDRACRDVAFLHTSGAYDVDGDSLSYELSVPYANATTPAPYTSPIDPRYYTNYSIGNEDDTGPPVFSIDPRTGLLTWDAAGLVGEYNIAFKVIEWRRDTLTGFYFRLSTTTRDMQIIVEECQNSRPRVEAPPDLCVVAGELVDIEVIGTDAEGDSVRIEVFSEIIDLPADQLPGSYEPPVASFRQPPARVRFRWQTDCIHVRQQPYQVVFKITDDPPRGPKLVGFKVWTVKVVAPAPEWKDPVLDVVKKQVHLSWEPYTCPQADRIQVWRKVDSFDYLPTTCSPGLPASLGYHLIGQAGPADTAFVDTNAGRELAAGATYCYRLVAFFSSSGGTASLTSDEQCFGPIRADAPVITHVSVEATDRTNGAVRVSWRSPMDIDRQQFPEPYRYEVFRALGFAGDSAISKIGIAADTTYLDSGINTREQVHNYRLVLYSRPQLAEDFVPVDTSEVASSEWLTAGPGSNRIELAWRDSVPWSNVVQSRPYHLVYRAKESEAIEDLVLIDSVNVSLQGYTYVDQGKYLNEAIESDKRYTYRVLTRGTYGNPRIALLENYSQTVTLYPENDLNPCPQRLAVAVVNCEQYLAQDNCGQNEFSNSISWSAITASACRKDFAFYRVYALQTPEGEYTLLGATRDTSFVEYGLPSFARCYRVSAVDERGQEGELSEPACNDNCPYYELPNVFTPNDDGFNDTFSSDFDRSGERGEGVVIRCPRFVRSVDFRVYNRLGKEVYGRVSSGQVDITIDWNGQSAQGELLPPGVYYYIAFLSFDALAPERMSRELRGWVQLVR